MVHRTSFTFIFPCSSNILPTTEVLYVVQTKPFYVIGIALLKLLPGLIIRKSTHYAAFPVSHMDKKNSWQWPLLQTRYC